MIIEIFCDILKLVNVLIFSFNWLFRIKKKNIRTEIFVTMSGIANMTNSNGSISNCVGIPIHSDFGIKNTSENKAGKITGIELNKTMEIVKAKTIQEILLYFLTFALLIMMKNVS